MKPEVTRIENMGDWALSRQKQDRYEKLDNDVIVSKKKFLRKLSNE